MIRSTTTGAREVAWARVVSFTPGATLQLGSQSEAIPLALVGAVYPAPRGETFNEIRISGTARVEWSNTHEDKP